LKTNTIGENVRQKVESGLGNPLLANLKAKRHAAAVARGTHFGFNSNAERFPERKIPDAESYLGPGYYEVQQAQSTFDKKA
jgi:hypothetical protein